jgi:hypothetical protein
MATLNRHFIFFLYPSASRCSCQSLHRAAPNLMCHVPKVSSHICVCRCPRNTRLPKRCRRTAAWKAALASMACGCGYPGARWVAEITHESLGGGSEPLSHRSSPRVRQRGGMEVWLPGDKLLRGGEPAGDWVPRFGVLDCHPLVGARESPSIHAAAHARGRRGGYHVSVWVPGARVASLGMGSPAQRPSPKMARPVRPKHAAGPGLGSKYWPDSLAGPGLGKENW